MASHQRAGHTTNMKRYCHSEFSCITAEGISAGTNARHRPRSAPMASTMVHGKQGHRRKGIPPRPQSSPCRRRKGKKSKAPRCQDTTDLEIAKWSSDNTVYIPSIPSEASLSPNNSLTKLDTEPDRIEGHGSSVLSIEVRNGIQLAEVDNQEIAAVYIQSVQRGRCARWHLRQQHQAARTIQPAHRRKASNVASRIESHTVNNQTMSSSVDASATSSSVVRKSKPLLRSRGKYYAFADVAPLLEESAAAVDPAFGPAVGAVVTRNDDLVYSSVFSAYGAVAGTEGEKFGLANTLAELIECYISSGRPGDAGVVLTAASIAALEHDDDEFLQTLKDTVASSRSLSLQPD